MDAQALNARLTRLEEQIKSGSFLAAQPAKIAVPAAPVDDYDDDRPPIPGDEDAPPITEEPSQQPRNDMPVGFWSDLVGAVRKELKPPVSGFFVATPNAPVQGALAGDKLELRCTNDFTAQMLDRPDILEIVSRKASAMLGRPLRAQVVDMNKRPQTSGRMEQLMNFGRQHTDIVKIKNN